MTLSNQIRKAIKTAPITRYRLCQQINFSEAAMSRFMAGKQGVSLDVLNKIAAVLGLRIVVDQKSPRKAKGKVRR